MTFQSQVRCYHYPTFVTSESSVYLLPTNFRHCRIKCLKTQHVVPNGIRTRALVARNPLSYHCINGPMVIKWQILFYFTGQHIFIISEVGEDRTVLLEDSSVYNCWCSCEVDVNSPATNSCCYKCVNETLPIKEDLNYQLRKGNLS